MSAADVPVALDLLAVCLAAGATPDVALTVVGGALSGQLGCDLESVAKAMRLGAPARQAWAHVTDGAPAALRHAAQRFDHAERSGAGLATALAALADDHRRALALERVTAARRVGVLAAGPLALCFLPAFVLTGVLPVVAGLLAGMRIS